MSGGVVVDQPWDGTNAGLPRHLLANVADAIEPVRPDALVPFAIEEEGARSAFSNWIAHRWFAPRSLKAEGARIDAVEGLFLPFWSFSAQTYSSYVGRRGEIRHRQVMRTRTDAQGKPETYWETETETVWHHVSGQVSRHFEGLIQPACAPLAEKAPHWTLTGLRPYVRGSAEGKRVIVYDVDPVSGSLKPRS